MLQGKNEPKKESVTKKRTGGPNKSIVKLEEEVKKE